MLIFLFLRLLGTQRLHNIELRGGGGGAGGIILLTLDANKLKQVLKYRKASFPASVSTTFVAHCVQKSCDPTPVQLSLKTFMSLSD